MQLPSLISRRDTSSQSNGRINDIFSAGTGPCSPAAQETCPFVAVSLDVRLGAHGRRYGLNCGSFVYGSTKIQRSNLCVPDRHASRLAAVCRKAQNSFTMGETDRCVSVDGRERSRIDAAPCLSVLRVRCISPQIYIRLSAPGVRIQIQKSTWSRLTGSLFSAKDVSDVHLVAALACLPTAWPRLAQRPARRRLTTDNPPSTFDFTLTPRVTLEMLPRP